MRHSKCQSVFALFVLVAACGGGGGGPGPGPGGADGGSDDNGPLTPPDEGTDYLYPDVAHTGFDGMHTFKVPLATDLTNVTWSVADPSIADVVGVPTPEMFSEFGETWAVVTTKKAGTTMVTASAGGKTVSSMLIVEAYEVAKVTAGEKRYNMPDDASGAQRQACISCHGLPNGVDHSPVALAFFADDEILSAVTTGKYPDGYVLMGVNHAWNLSDAEKGGIVPYLRQLPLRGF